MATMAAARLEAAESLRFRIQTALVDLRSFQVGEQHLQGLNVCPESAASSSME